MTQAPKAEDVAKARVVYTMPGEDEVGVRQDVEFRGADGGVLTMDVYSPVGGQIAAGQPAVVVVAGYPDEGMKKILGCRFKEMGSSVSWGRLVAASGMIAISYTNREPVADVHALMKHLHEQGRSLGVDSTRIGLWASSGNVPLALSLLMKPEDTTVKCAALCYGYMLDRDEATGVADAAAMFKFVNPGAGRSVDEVPKDLPLFVARAGEDQMPRLNESIDRFVTAALARNLPLTVVNHASGPHAFDLFDANETSRRIVKEVLRFLQFHLNAPAVEGGSASLAGTNGR